MTKKPTVVITGASGLLGSELVKHFSTLGYNVRALVRTPEKFSNTKNISYHAYDMDGAVDDAPFKGASHLIHAAYIKDGGDVLERNVEATKKVLEKSKANGLKKNIFISSMSANKDAVAAYGRQKYIIEKLFKNKHDTIIRSGLIIGDGGLAKQIMTFMKTKHIAPLIDNGKQPLQIISVQDMAKAIDKIIDKNISGLLTIGTPRVYTYKEFYETIKEKKNIKALLVPVPFVIPLYVIRLVKALRLPLGVTEDNLQGLRQLRSYDTRQDLKKIGLTVSELHEIL